MVARVNARLPLIISARVSSAVPSASKPRVCSSGMLYRTLAWLPSEKRSVAEVW